VGPMTTTELVSRRQSSIYVMCPTDHDIWTTEHISASAITIVKQWLTLGIPFRADEIFWICRRFQKITLGSMETTVRFNGTHYHRFQWAPMEVSSTGNNRMPMAGTDQPVIQCPTTFYYILVMTFQLPFGLHRLDYPTPPSIGTCNLNTLNNMRTPSPCD